MDEEIKRFVMLLTPTLRDEINEAGQAAMLIVTPDSFDTTDPAIAEWLANRTQLVSAGINQETDKQLRAELAEGIANGESIEELKARIERVYGAAAGFRAERIARTETIRAENYASQAAWRQSEVVSAKEWYTAHDERTCEFCGPMDGRIVDLDTNYFDKGDTYTGSKGGTVKLTYDDTPGPPLHANCRCTLLPVLKGDD